jgi:uncharacterized protein (DUF1800 family)
MKRAGLLWVPVALCACLGLLHGGEVQPGSWVNDLTPIGPADWNADRAAHLLERAGFGGTPQDVQKLAAMTPAQAVDSLVDYEKIDDSQQPAFEPSGIYPHGHKLLPLQKVVPRALMTGKAYGIKATREGDLPYQPAINEFYTLLISEHVEMRRAGWWWGQRMLLTPRPLQEKLTLFWHDHFATSQEKVLNYELMLRQNQTLRRHAAGNFRKLLTAVAQDPAMLVWLDNKDNVKGKPNENFAREVMELFTMGEGHGYTETDIREMARAFTGWTLRPIETTKDDARFVDDSALHDDGEKAFLGARGKFNGYDAIDIILKQPATPRFLAKKLYRHFVRQEVAPEFNDRLAQVLLDANYELKPLLKTMFLSRDFYSPPSVGTQIKGPVHFVVSTYRKLGLRSLPGVPDFNETTGALGQVLFFPPNVAGWPGGRSWINPATLLVRGNFAHTLLFPDPAAYGNPDKVVSEGYRKIPLAFQQYKITPHVWDPQKQHMEPVSLAAYDRFLAGIDQGAMKAMGSPAAAMKKEGAQGDVKILRPGETRSKMSQVANNERYNLAVGVYTGFVEGYNRVKPIPRTTAEVDFVAMARAAKTTTVEEAVEYFERRFLRVGLHPERRSAIVAFLRQELQSDQLSWGDRALPSALRRTAHLILSAPEYQLG